MRRRRRHKFNVALNWAEEFEAERFYEEEVMALTSGTRLGAYEVQAQIGAGAWARCIARATASLGATWLSKSFPQIS